jgi:hypothetical protein
MIDHPAKTERLLAAFRDALPFEVELTPRLSEYLRAQRIALGAKKRYAASALSYAGDEGGIVCHIGPRVTPHPPMRLRRMGPSLSRKERGKGRRRCYFAGVCRRSAGLAHDPMIDTSRSATAADRFARSPPLFHTPPLAEDALARVAPRR